jgi:uncharacterized protein involved in outer membrane biogenesis
MQSSKGRKWGLIGVVILLILIVGGVLAFRSAVALLKGKVEAALGPGSHIKELKVGWSSVEVRGLRIEGSQGWPTKETLRAERVFIVPSLSSLLTGEVKVGSIAVVSPYLSALRSRDGKLIVLPSLLSRSARPETPSGAHGGAPARTVTISRVTLRDGVVEFFDATVAQPPLKIRLEQIQASVRDVVAPALTGKTRFDLTGVLKGVQQDGQASVSGWAEVMSKDSSVHMRLKSVDLVALQPYLRRAAETRVNKGVLDLDLDSQVSNRRLRAPGKLVISDLDLAAAHGTVDTFMGTDRNALIKYLKSTDDKIRVDFVITGDLDNPGFSLNEFFAKQVASALKETVGPLAVEVLKQKALEQAGKTGAAEGGKGTEGALKEFKGLFGGEKK